MVNLLRIFVWPPRAIVAALVCAMTAAGPALRADASEASSGAIAMYGTPALPAGFSHLPYANPDAPKGGKLVVGFEGTFDSLNPFNLKAGSTAQGINGNIYQTLMTRSLDEPFTLYGLVAQSIETDAARSYATFRVDPRARFSDGSAITAADIVFTFNLLKKKGRPQQRAAYSFVAKVATLDAMTVRFDFAGSKDRELPMILALMPVLSHAGVDPETFDQTSLKLPVGSGPYHIVAVKPGMRLVLKRDLDYWGKDLPTQRGLYNFDEIDIEYFRDSNALFEAFKAGLIDARIETNPQRWASAYDFPALREGRVKRESLPFGGPKGMEGFAFNLRRPLFRDIKIREALGFVFDFEWVNAKLFSGLYTRSKSFFDESDLASVGHPASDAERRLLAPYPNAVQPDVMDGKRVPPVSDGSGEDRAGARKALSMLETAGYRLEDGRLVKDGVPLAFEIMVKDRNQERLALSYQGGLRRIGVDATVRLVDEVQYQRRRQKFDFDMMIGLWQSTASPGNEQRSRWGSASASQEASFNLAGARDPAIDGLIDAMLGATSQEDFFTAVRAYDRVLLSGSYIVPLFHASDEWVAAKIGLAHPAASPHYGPPASATFDTWWRTSP
ncbi:extracellular solute-binding protein [Beijerinckia sp. L45]|uniref:extracellular solute-binding protein n=1 Tax=Beijerinckia sp. L45 TaxID=1641855 RepID=UPI001FF00A37|nr:extracellular solute-binding protein [Beijerinckia sp. L45]